MRQPKIITTFKTYDRQQFVADLVAGTTVALVAIPLSLAIAIASGAPPEKGLVTAVIGGFLISAFGGSRVQIGGPTGAFIVVVYGVIAEHGYEGLVLATAMAGIFLLAAGYLRMGRLIAYVPEAVVNGFTIGIAIIIAASQLKDFLGLSIDQLPAEFIEKMVVLWDGKSTVNELALGAAILTMALVLILRRLAPKVPGLIIAVIATSALSAFFAPSVETIFTRFGNLPASLPPISIPDVSLPRLIELLPSALIIAFLAGVESLLSAMVADKMIGGSHRPNAELTAQGIANFGSAVFTGLPATGAIARTATNVRAGAKTPVAGIIHAAVVLMVLLFASSSVAYLAMPALAAILMLAAWNMSEPQKWKEYMKARTSDRILLVLTLVLTVLADLTIAIGVGVGIGLALRLNRRSDVNSDWTPPER